MKQFAKFTAFMLCMALAFPSFSITPVDEAPDGYLRAEDGQKAPEGYLPATSKTTQRDAGKADRKPEGFVPAETLGTDSVDGGKLMLIAYAGFWLLALLYIAMLAGRARRTGKEVVELHRQLQELDDRIEDLETRRQA